MLLKFSNFLDELSENDELREYELSRADCTIMLCPSCFVIGVVCTPLLATRLQEKLHIWCEYALMSLVYAHQIFQYSEY